VESAAQVARIANARKALHKPIGGDALLSPRGLIITWCWN
jgi:hypothetical protein